LTSLLPLPKSSCEKRKKKRIGSSTVLPTSGRGEGGALTNRVGEGEIMGSRDITTLRSREGPGGRAFTQP